ncbi:MAG: primosomal protein N' [Oscillatoriales cyanobacterium SM2_2_1]|nr:primosomal protein N' [Oscillatoriales cyanobacterium SM2_2_1]
MEHITHIGVLVDCSQIEEVLTYRVPPEWSVQVGDILTVPLGSRYVAGIALQVGVDPGDRPCKPIAAVVRSGLLPADFWQLLHLTATYYRTPLWQVVKTALPPKLLDRANYRLRVIGESQALTGAAREVWEFLQPYRDRPQGVSRSLMYQRLGNTAVLGCQVLQRLGCVESFLVLPPKPQPRMVNYVALLDPHAAQTARQQEILGVLQRCHGECAQSELLKLARTTSASLKQLQKLGAIVLETREVLRVGGKDHPVARDCPPDLTEPQRAALEQILPTLGQRHSHEFLLYGITGSGKTEVYLRAIAHGLAQGLSALVLVPEIGLTPQLTDRFRARFGDACVFQYHSQLSDGERFDTWRLSLRPQPQVLIGTRSAVFLPLPNLGLIILDEEHDSSFKQDQPLPCYHARTVAQWRSHLQGIPIIYGSATPSTDLWHRSENLDLTRLELPQRIGDRPRPPIGVVDMREELRAGNWSMFSRTLKTAIAQMLSQRHQGILFVPRRGHSTFVSCRSCGHVMMCPHCDVSLTYHHNGLLRCHYCNYSLAQPDRCPVCQSTYFKFFGTGTQKVVQELEQLFPSARLLRFDSDTTQRKDAYRQMLDQFRGGEADLLIGTQMLTKGMDIPQVTLVGIMAADGQLHFSDFRAGERAMQTLLQVAGRAGRGEQPGQVILQTYSPEHPVIQAVCAYDWEGFMVSELDQRRAFAYPPFGQLALLHFSGQVAEHVMAAAGAIAQVLTQQTKGIVLGPAPATIAKVADRYRWQILVKYPPDCPLDLPELEILRAQLPHRQVRLTLDIDPLQIL